MFLIVQHQGQSLVFDLATTLPFPVSFSQYAAEAVKWDFFDKRCLALNNKIILFTT